MLLGAHLSIISGFGAGFGWEKEKDRRRTGKGEEMDGIWTGFWQDFVFSAKLGVYRVCNHLECNRIPIIGANRTVCKVLICKEIRG